MKAYFVDTNILIDIYGIVVGKIDPNKSRYHRNYTDLLELVTNGEIGVLVVPTVGEEIRNGSHKDGAFIERFIQKFCVECQLDAKEMELAELLYDEYISGDENSAVPVFKDNGKSIQYNTKDARILAEVTVLYNRGKYDAIKFITNNIGDFINVPEINKINAKYGLKSVPFNSMKASNVKKEIR